MTNDVMSIDPMMENGIEETRRQVLAIQKLYKDVMQLNVHYGVIPGCGNKPTLLKAGAEKLAFVFRLAPTFEILKTDLPRDHREYEVKCILKHMHTGALVGEGVGCASTMESKHRYRKGESVTGEPVDHAYWNAKKANDAAKMKEISQGRFPKKMPDGNWYWAISGEKVENEDPADQYNTVLKMAKKRALVDAILTATAASDMFTQDIEDFQSDYSHEGKPKDENQTKKEDALKDDKPPKKEEKSERKALAERNKKLIDDAVDTWIVAKGLSKVEGKSEAMNKIHIWCSEKIGKVVKDYADLLPTQAAEIADMFIEELK